MLKYNILYSNLCQDFMRAGKAEESGVPARPKCGWSTFEDEARNLCSFFQLLFAQHRCRLCLHGAPCRYKAGKQAHDPQDAADGG